MPGAGTQPVKWELVDPHLKMIRGRGGMTALSRAIGVSRKTLWMRRKELGLDPLVTGRKAANKRDLTKTEAEVMEKIKGGATEAEVARARGVSRQAVHGAVTRAAAKGSYQAFIESRCATCGGDGIVLCAVLGKCRPICPGAPSHVCDACGGSGEKR
jgi:DNA-binding CsgD family transcriptional regulator